MKQTIAASAAAKTNNEMQTKQTKNNLYRN